MIGFFASVALAQDPGSAPPVLELTGVGRASYDLVLFVRYDGNLYLDDMLIMESDLQPMVAERVAADPDLRIVISADPRAPFEGIVKVMALARTAGASRTALEVVGIELPQTPDDPLFPGAGEVTELDPTLTDGQLRELKPKRFRFPQNPYGNTTSFTSYTLEWGETKIGPGSVNVGIFPRVQVGTVPVLDVLGVFNVNAKANIVREGPIDGAIIAQYYAVPVTKLLESAGVDIGLGDDATLKTSAAYLGIGATASLQVLEPWTVHTQIYWARPTAKGEIAFDDLPDFLFNGLSIGGTGEIALGVTGDLAVLNLATDLRFNRRDSTFVWLRYPFYGNVRGDTGGEVSGVDELENVRIQIAYGDSIPFADSYSIAGGYQASWKHWEARIGVGWGGTATAVGGVPLAWLLQAFEVSYKFGGSTRSTEGKIRKGFRENRQDLRELPPIPSEG